MQTKDISCNSANKSCLLQVVQTKAIAALSQFCDFFQYEKYTWNEWLFAKANIQVINCNIVYKNLHSVLRNLYNSTYKKSVNCNSALQWMSFTIVKKHFYYALKDFYYALKDCLFQYFNAIVVNC